MLSQRRKLGASLATVMMVVFLVAAAVFVYAYLSSPGWRY